MKTINEPERPTPFGRFLARNAVFAWLALATAGLLTIPWLAMLFTDEVRWTAGDFAVMAVLLFGTGSAFVLLARRLPTRLRGLLAMACVLAFACVWVALAVGL